MRTITLIKKFHTIINQIVLNEDKYIYGTINGSLKEDLEDVIKLIDRMRKVRE